MMSWFRSPLVFFVLFVAGCGIPPVDTEFISSVPADTQSFAVAERAVRACTDVIDREKVRRNLERAGFGVTIQQVKAKNGRTIPHMIISAPHEAVSVLYLGSSCFVGLENMTPDQSARLARIWVDAHGAQPNSAFGDGLSDHVSGAWRRFFTEPHRFPDKAAYRHRIYIAAYKTWPNGPYDPQRSVPFSIPDFPAKPGAAVELNHAFDCLPDVRTGPTSGVLLQCSGPEYRPG
ncbi:hypothetical protein [uncultured Roseobacter sp.]|uniref:hypothetical protein n=1 Tax=uncultured Roseobacter sp. TaxID=114847 RepID=UPI002622E1B5|nr:hypothetical protein [uncultured Roseobacter sp.]